MKIVKAWCVAYKTRMYTSKKKAYFSKAAIPPIEEQRWKKDGGKIYTNGSVVWHKKKVGINFSIAVNL